MKSHIAILVFSCAALTACFNGDSNNDRGDNGRGNNGNADQGDIKVVNLMNNLAALDENDEPVAVNEREITFEQGDSFDDFISN